MKNTSEHNSTVVRIFGLRHHRGLSSTLCMAKPNTAKTVAPMLTLSQKVEVFRSVWVMCLLNTEEPETDKHKRPDGKQIMKMSSHKSFKGGRKKNVGD